MWDECGTSWTNFRDQKLDQNFKQVSSCARSLDPGPLSRLRNEGFSANTCFSRPPHAPGHIEMILAFQTFRAEPEKNLSFPPVLHGFSHCGTHRDFDLACRVLPPWLRSFSRCAHSILCDSATNLSPRCTGVSAETHVGAWSTRVRVPRRRASASRSVMV